MVALLLAAWAPTAAAAPPDAVRTGGPSAGGDAKVAGAFYEDNADNYVTSEPALDHTASSLFLMAAVSP